MANSFRFSSHAKSRYAGLEVKQFKKPATICLNNLSSYQSFTLFMVEKTHKSPVISN
jgi:hypothetical protein